MNAKLLTLTLLAGGFAGPAIAASAAPITPADVAAHQARMDGVRAKLAAAALAHPIDTHGGKAMGSNTFPGTPLANPYRAYPPSCAAYPLPDAASGGVVTTARMPLYSRDSNGSGISPETVTVTIWRIACSSSGSLTPYNADGGFNAMTLMRIDRDPGNDGHTDFFPTFPNLQVAQGGVGFSGVASLARAATEPNTVVVDAPYDAPIYSSTTYVLENYNDGPDFNHLYSYAFTLRIDPFISGVDPVDFQIGDYTPTPSSYPYAFAPLPLDGYSAAQWINTQYNEGLLLQITEQLQSDGSTVRQVVFDLLTEDLNGDPLWLVGNAAFPVGQTTLPIDLAYLGNGLAQVPYGTATIEVSDCNHLDVTYAANSNLPAPIPTINGLTTYFRLFNANGMVCE